MNATTARPQAGALDAGPTPDGGLSPSDLGSLIFETTMRGRAVRCWIEDRTIHRDPDLLRRLERFLPGDVAPSPVALANLVRDAVGSDVTIRVGPSTSAGIVP